MTMITIEDIKTLTGSELKAWIEEAEDHFRFGRNTKETADRMNCTPRAVRWLLAYWDNRNS